MKKNDKIEKLPFSVTLHGKPLSASRYMWDSNTKMFISSCYNLVISVDEGIPDAGNDITFITPGNHCCFFGLGSRCIFVAGMYCMFEVVSHCSFCVGYGSTVVSDGGDCEIWNTQDHCAIIYMADPEYTAGDAYCTHTLAVGRTLYLDRDGLLTEVSVKGQRVIDPASVQVSVGGKSLTIDVTLTSDQLAFVQNKVKQLKVEA